MHIPTTVVHPCDSPTMTPGVTPGFSSPSSPTPMRRAFSGSLSTETDSLTHAKSWSNSGFFGWLTRSPSQRIQEEPTFFHQKEDMSSLQGLTSKSRLFKPRPKMPVSMSDVNVFTPTEYWNGKTERSMMFWWKSLDGSSITSPCWLSLGCWTSETIS